MAKSSKFTFSKLWTNPSDDKKMLCFLFSQKIGYGISCKLSPSLGDNLHEMSNPVFCTGTEYLPDECDDMKMTVILYVQAYNYSYIQIIASPEFIKNFSCSTQLSMNFVLLINLKLLTISYSFLLNIAEHENFSANKYENANYCWHFHIY